MASAHTLSASASETAHDPETTHDSETAVTTETASEQAMVPSLEQNDEDEPIKLSAPVARLPVELDVAIPVREFRVRNLLAIEPGQIVETQWAQGQDLPLASGQTQLAWSEFEVIDTQLAVRVTRLI